MGEKQYDLVWYHIEIIRVILFSVSAPGLHEVT